MDAVVLHERPSGLRSAFRIEIKGGMMHPLIARAAGRRFNIRRLVGRCEQALIASTIPMVVVCLKFYSLYFILLPGLLCLIRRSYFKNHSRPMFRSLSKDFGLMSSLGLMICFSYLNASANLIGFLVGTFRFRRAVVVPGMTTRPRVKTVITNEREGP